MLSQNATDPGDHDWDILKTEQGKSQMWMSQITWWRSADWLHVLSLAKTYYTAAWVAFDVWLTLIFFVSKFTCSNNSLLIKHIFFCQAPNSSFIPVLKSCDTIFFCLSQYVIFHTSVQPYKSSANCYRCIVTWPVSILQVIVITLAKPTVGARVSSRDVKMMKIVNMFNHQCQSRHPT